MGNLGMGVMIRMLLGDDTESATTYRGAIGKTISEIVLSPDGKLLTIRFTDGTGVCFLDDGQSCCEHRYMTTDDKLDDFVGATFTAARIASAADRPDGDDNVHEVQFLHIDTSKGTFTVESHNEHNGYYGGFALICRTAEGC